MSYAVISAAASRTLVLKVRKIIEKSLVLFVLYEENKLYKYIERILREKCQNTEFHLVRIFLYSLLSPNTGKYGLGRTPHLDTFYVVGMCQTEIMIITMLLIRVMIIITKSFALKRVFKQKITSLKMTYLF